MLQGYCGDFSATHIGYTHIIPVVTYSLNLLLFFPNNFYRFTYVDVVKNLNFRKYRETLYSLQTNATGINLSKMWDLKKMTPISEALLYFWIER